MRKRREGQGREGELFDLFEGRMDTTGTRPRWGTG